jgi:hypothetical protein
MKRRLTILCTLLLGTALLTGIGALEQNAFACTPEDPSSTESCNYNGTIVEGAGGAGGSGSGGSSGSTTCAKQCPDGSWSSIGCLSNETAHCACDGSPVQARPYCTRN